MNKECNKRVQDTITRFLTKDAGPDKSIKSWLFNNFPKGLQQIANAYDAQGEDARTECDGLFNDCHMSGMSFAHPNFDGAYAAVQNACKDVYYGRKVEVFDALHVSKVQYDKTREKQVFFEQEFLPRLKELHEGAPVQSTDYEMFYLAQQYGKSLAKAYNAYVNEAFKPAPGTYAAYMTFLTHILEIIPPPPNWQQRRLDLDSANDKTFPLGDL